MITTILGCLIGNILFFSLIGLIGFFIFNKSKEKINSFITLMKEKITEIDNLINDIETLVNDLSSAMAEIKKLQQTIDEIKSKLDKLPF